MKIIKRLLFTAIALSLLAGIVFFCSFPAKDIALVKPGASADHISRAQENIVSTYEQKAKLLEQTNDSLTLTIAQSQSNLQSLRKQVRELKFSLSQNIAADISKDTGQIRQDVSELILLTDQQDSLCQQTIGEFQELVFVKDTMLQNCMTRITQTDSLLTESLQVQRNMEQQFKTQTKALKKSRRAVSFLSSGLLVFSTASLALLLTRH